ncbi:DUF951 domain-containing protein [Fructobacillus durionis]|uniref:DUF951 domain-containing protein n=1 Tax=Fructobacillus durionis TaxID=283737 RepID=A0A1I1DSP8_9LACO|nr:DUF951 domain-containing protein [Fructobacillus durionis]SFB77422.1 hypothetical protein SAMN05660453_0085 [Fructobacillus durionis]
MVDQKDYGLGDLVEMKKPHACGTNAWIINRMGADIKLTCSACERTIMLTRFNFDKRLKKVLKKADDKQED